MALTPGRLPSHMIMHILSDFKWGAEVQMQADAFRDTCAPARPLPCPVSLCSSAEKQIMRRDGLIFPIFVSLLRVMHAGQPSNLSTLLQSQTKSGMRARSFTVCVCIMKVHPSAQGSVQYICARRIMKVPGLYRHVHVHSHMYGCCTCKCYDCT